jgi:hypothetical protein
MDLYCFVLVILLVVVRLEKGVIDAVPLGGDH